ncbi:MAG: hypothetical protein Q7R56_02295 [Nanoarchaeota archaeon]|nr:hypothetical protein [Nanoarchaeota archaeon]
MANQKAYWNNRLDNMPPYSAMHVINSWLGKDYQFTRKLEEQLEEEFNDIRGEDGDKYVVGLHDCDDQTQRYRDVMRRYNVPTEQIVLVFGRYLVKEEGHLWTEVFESNSWWTFDPVQNRFRQPVEEIRKKFFVYKVLPGDAVYKDDGGYQNIGDRFVNGQWVPSEKSGTLLTDVNVSTKK